MPHPRLGPCIVWLGACVVLGLMVVDVNAAVAIPFTQNYYVGWSPDRVWLSDRGYVMNLKLDNRTGSGFTSKSSYLHGYVSMKIRLVPRNSAGVVVAYYLTSERTDTWDEIDFEFLGNVTGEPWILQTNIFTNGTGGREERIFLWFDPTKTFHTYSILWNSHQIVWYVDAVPFRVYRNTPVTAATYPSVKPMAVYTSIWDGDDWATRGGLVKINWTYSPFIVSYSKFLIDACKWQNPKPACAENTSGYWWDNQSAWTLSPVERQRYNWARKGYTVYDYCKDEKRYPTPPPECKVRPWD